MQLCIEYLRITNQTLRSFSSTVQNALVLNVSCPLSI